MGDLPNLPVTVATDWWMLGLQLFIAVLSFLGTLLGVYLGIKLSMKSFYSEKWWERKADAYLICLDVIDTYLMKLVMDLGYEFQFSENSDEEIQAFFEKYTVEDYGSHFIPTSCVKYFILLNREATNAINTTTKTDFIDYAEVKLKEEFFEAIKESIDDVRGIRKKFIQEMRKDLKVD